MKRVAIYKCMQCKWWGALEDEGDTIEREHPLVPAQLIKYECNGLLRKECQR